MPNHAKINWWSHFNQSMIETLKIRPTFSLICLDLDGTIFDLSHKNNIFEFKKFLNFLKLSRQNGSLIIFATGRNKKDARELIIENKLPQPDFLIADLGLEIYDKKNLILPNFKINLDPNWSPKYIDQLTKKFTEIVPRDRRRSTFYKRTFYLYQTKNTIATIKNLERLFLQNGIRTKIFYTKEKYLYIIPRAFTKESTLLFLLKKLNLSKNDVLVAGDDETDIGLLKTFKNSILVGNTTKSLKKLIKNKYPHVYRSNNHAVSGLIEGINYISSIRHRELEAKTKIILSSFQQGKFYDALSATQKIKVNNLLEGIVIKLFRGEIYEKTGRFQRAKKNYIMARALAVRARNEYLAIAAEIQISRTDITLGNIKQGLSRLKNLISKQISVLNKELFINTLNAIGYGYRLTGDKESARHHLDRAIKFCQRDSNTSNKLTLTIMHNKAGLLRELLDYRGALKIYLSVIKQTNKNDAFFRARLFNNAGFIYRKMEQYKNALAFYTKAYKLERQIGVKQLQARTLNNLGGIARMQGNFKKAFKYFSESANLRKRLHDPLGLSSSLLNKGITLKYMARNTAAKKYLMQSYKIRKQSGSKYLIKEVLIELKNLC